MDKGPLTIDQARKLCEDYQYLQGRVLSVDELGEHRIDCVAVSPSDDLNKWLFTSFYNEYGCPIKALEYYTYSDFDVLLLHKTLRDQKPVYKDVRTYIEERARKESTESTVGTGTS
jgi:hypothetical protein